MPFWEYKTVPATLDVEMRRVRLRMDEHRVDQAVKAEHQSARRNARSSFSMNW